MTRHVIKLDGDRQRGARVALRVLRLLSAVLIDVAQRSLRLRVEGRTNLKGKAAWLEGATAIELVGLEPGSTALVLEAPELGEAVPEIFEHLPLWDYSPARNQTALDLVKETLCEALRGNEESDLLDKNVLAAISPLTRLLANGVSALTFEGGAGREPLRITKAGLRLVQSLKKGAPPSRRVVVAGRLDQLTGSQRSFRLALPEGQSVRGVLPEGDLEVYASLWTKRVVVDGQARFRPSGMVSLVLAECLRPASEADAVWETMPEPRPVSIADLRPRRPSRPGSSGMEEVFGRWPGDETTEELLAELATLG